MFPQSRPDPHNNNFLILWYLTINSVKQIIMVTQRRWLSALLPLLSVANATLTQELRDRKLPDCSSDIVYSDIEDKGTFWYNTGAEQFANDYINSNTDHTMWAQNLFRELLGNRDYSNFDCRTTGATCDTPGDMCDQLNAVNKGGLFYLFVSLRNFHTNMASFEKDVNNNFLKSAVSVSQIQEILNIPDGTSDESPDLLSIFGSAVGIAGGAAGLASGPFGATAGAVSGIFSILSTLDSGSVAPDNTLKSAAKIDKMVEDTITKTNDIISKLVGAVFGRPGQSQDVIPDNMRHGGVDNPAVQVFGWGSWLKEHSNTVEAEQFAKKFQEKTSQSLLWQMGRLYKKMFVVLRTDVQKDKCTEPNNAWDEEKSRCMDLLTWNGADDSTLGGGNDLIANKMWQSWNMDPYWTMKNAVTCWEEHDGHIGDVEPTQVWESDVPPPCFFAMEVVSGSYYVRGKGMIELGGDFARQHGLDGMLWPKSKCEENSKYWEISDHCEYSWIGDE